MPLKDYLSPNADKLIDKVDLTKMIGDFGRAGFAALFAAVTGYILSIKKGFDKFGDTFVNSAERLVFVLVQTFGSSTDAARMAAQTQLSEFSLFALPASIVISLSAVVAAVVVFAIFWGDA